MSALQDHIELALGIVAILGVIFGWLRWIRPRVRKGVGTWVAIRDSIIGREAQHDSITGRETAPALPGIGVRMESVEQSQIETRQAIEHIASLIEGQQQQDRRIDGIEGRVKLLEEQVIERVANKAESVAAFRAIEAVAKQTDTSTELEK